MGANIDAARLFGRPRRNYQSQHRNELAWFCIGDSLPVKSMSAESAAKKILRACQDGRGEVLIHSPLNLTIALQNLFPELTQEVIAVAGAMLPKMGGIGGNSAKGHESELS